MESPKTQTSNTFFVTLSAIIALLTKRLNGKPKSAPTKPIKDGDWPPKSPLTKPKKLLSNISNKAFGQKRKKKQGVEDERGWGNGGVWQKEILMGGKCQPLDFSGVIYYDVNGEQTRDVPLRSPRASPMPGYLTRPRNHAL